MSQTEEYNFYACISPDTRIVQYAFHFSGKPENEHGRFVAISEDDFNQIEQMLSSGENTGYKLLASGSLEKCDLPLKNLVLPAKVALQSVQADANMASAMGEKFGPETLKYISSLRDIAGKDEYLGVSLPTKPSSYTD